MLKIYLFINLIILIYRVLDEQFPYVKPNIYVLRFVNHPFVNDLTMEFK